MLPPICSFPLRHSVLPSSRESPQPWLSGCSPRPLWVVPQGLPNASHPTLKVAAFYHQAKPIRCIRRSTPGSESTPSGSDLGEQPDNHGSYLMQLSCHQGDARGVRCLHRGQVHGADFSNHDEVPSYSIRGENGTRTAPASWTHAMARDSWFDRMAKHVDQSAPFCLPGTTV